MNDTDAEMEAFEFTLRLINEEGILTTLFRGERMQRLTTQKMDRIYSAHLEIHDSDGLLWVWTAPHGQHYIDSGMVYLEKPVGYRLSRPQSPALQIEGLDANIFFEQRIVTTQNQVIVEHAGLRTTGTGMRTALDDSRVEWFSDVTSEYRPSDNLGSVP